MKILDTDVAIVGSGSVHTVAMHLAKGGKKVVLIEQDELGGTCALHGCLPKKYLVEHAHIRMMIRHLLTRGFETLPKSSWSSLQAAKEEFTKSVPNHTRKLLQAAGVEFVQGKAVFGGTHSLKVGDSYEINAKKIIVATGSKPKKAKEIEGSQHILNSDDFLNLKELPKNTVFIGGGYITMEFAHILGAFGSKVTIIHRGDTLLKRLDQEISSRLENVLADMDINIIKETTVSKIKKVGGAFEITDSNGTLHRCEKIFSAIGRVPNLSVLEGGLGEVEYNAHGIKVNSFCQSISNPDVYAAGDAAATPFMLSSTADQEARVAARNILHGNSESIDYDIVPTSIFTYPEAAAVGLDEMQARSQGLSFEIYSGETKEWSSSKRIGEEHGFYKIIVEKKSARILGAHLIRHHASELINLFALAIKTKATTHDLKHMMWAYPNFTSDIRYMLS
ncbi:NAD(P)/FAD-dependent oxidoreductase [Sulfurimonas sp. HSL-1716]|uniref:dihydrolipoyl dehydrogenase family protein n=1 Tax=Hydrocurvibacter sulfurireducens TaxID=3131937 RepID=UPI0031F9DD88